MSTVFALGYRYFKLNVPLKGWTYLTLAHMEKSIISGYELFSTNIYSIAIRFMNIF